MSVKVVIANNDILYNSLSNITLQYALNIEIINVPTDRLSSLICQIKPKEHVLILDSITSISFWSNILKNLTLQMDKANVIIFVIDSKTVTNIINREKPHFLFKNIIKKTSIIKN